MDSTTIVLPAAVHDEGRPQLPLLAAVVPVIAGLVLWAVTGSLFALCFAALGPLMLAASYVDGLRSRKKARGRAQRESDAAWQRADAECERLHVQEHATLWRRHPDIVQCLTEPPLTGHCDLEACTDLVIGRGSVRSRVRASGGDDERSRRFRERAQQLTDAPIVVELGGGLCVRAARPVAEAVVRALVAQLCLRFSPNQLALLGVHRDDDPLADFPHARRRRAAFQLALAETDQHADALICVRSPDQEPPAGVTTVLDCAIPAQGRARLRDGTVLDVSVEALSVQQTRLIASQIADRSQGEAAVPDVLAFDDVEVFRPAGRASGLSAAFGRGEHGELSVDLVEDGPHAIVTGMTGTGKSELLISWVSAIAAAHSPDEVAFVLIDFKGGTAFDPLRALPHVAAVVTDLDAEGARRGVGSLTAELRRREAALVQAGARDVRDCPALGRLVVVVDEFAAMVQEHPDLSQVFTDVAARGRALGMHLVLGTQRASGIIRDALAANCPLRMSLRVAETADSRFVIGSDAAALLPGGAEARGLAYVRRPRDAEAHTVRIALTAQKHIDALVQQWQGSTRPLSPWLPPLPGRVEVPDSVEGGPDDVAVLGLADDPDHQSQPWVTLRRGDGLAIIGGPGAGKTTALAALAAQLTDAVIVPRDPELAWDAVAELSRGRHGLVLCDDLDVLLGSYPAEHAQLFSSRWEMIVRSPAGAVITASRVSGPLTKLMDSLPRRALLRLSGKVEHITAGGESRSYHRNRPDGRAWLDENEVQLCWSETPLEAPREGMEPELWRPRCEVTGVITGAVAATTSMLAETHRGVQVMGLGEYAASAQRALGDATVRRLAAAPQRIVIGDPEQWRACWAQLQGIRTAGEMVVAAECATELRQLVGVRDLPPYARQHEDRAWATASGSRPRRVLLA